jgi:hypothetical protein
MGNSKIYIEPSEDLKSVRQRIKSCKDRKIILIFPEENINLKNIESLTVLNKDAKYQEKIISIYSTDPDYRDIAEDCGIEIEKTLIGGSSSVEGEENDSKPFLRDIISHQLKPQQKEEKQKSKQKKETVEIKKQGIPEDLEEKKVMQKNDNDQGNKEDKNISIWKRKINTTNFLYFLTIFLILAGIVFSIFWLPKAEISVFPSSEEMQFSGNFQIRKDAKLNIGKNVIPALVLEKEKQADKDFVSSSEGQRKNKAKGIVTLYNQADSNHQFIKGTRFKTSDGKIFKSTSPISVPAGSATQPSTIEVEVIASEAGEQYNIDPTSFKLPGLEGMDIYTQVYAKSTQKMEGGFIGETKFVSEEDLLDATKEMNILQEIVAKEAKEEILKQLSPKLKFLENEIVIVKDKILFNKEEGDPGESFHGTAKVKAQLLTFSETNSNLIISKSISEQIKEGALFEEIKSSQIVQYHVLENSKKDTYLNISFSGSEKVAWKVDEPQIKKDIKSKKITEVQDYFKKEMGGKVNNTHIALWPFWVVKIPKIDSRIKITIEYK